MANLRNNQKLLWILAIGVWMLGCAILLLGGGIWLGRQTENNGKSTITKITSQLETQMEEETPTTLPINTPLPASTTLPTDTPTPEESNEEKADNQSGNEGIESQSDTSSGDHLVLPTATPTPVAEGVIIFLSSRDYDPQKNSAHLELELYAMNPDGSQQTRLAIAGVPNQRYLDWLAPYYQPNQIVLAESMSAWKAGYIYDIVQLKYVEMISPLVTNSPSPTLLAPSWSKDGDIVFGSMTPQDRLAIFYQGRDQGEVRQLTFLPSSDVWGDGWPVWSPDGEWIAFSRDWSQNDKNGIWLIKPDGTGAQQIIAMNTRIIEWSPDGSKLAFQGRDNRSGFDIWVADADGSHQRQLSFFPSDFDTYDMRLSWSPDSRQIVFHMGEKHSGAGDIYAVAVDGSEEPRQLTTAGDYNISPIWLPISMEDIPASMSASPPPTPADKPVSAPPPPPPAPLNCPSPGVQITSPRSGARFTDRYNYIVGTANINSFHHWKMEYSTDPNGGWQYLLERDYPVDNDKLVMIDASTIPNGPYGLRLTVVDATGNYPQPCEIWFTNGY